MTKTVKEDLSYLVRLFCLGSALVALGYGASEALPPPGGSEEAAGAAAGGRFTGPDGQPLPWKTDQEVLEFLRSARVVSTKELSSGINRPLKLRLEKNGVEAHAVFRSVDQKKDRVTLGGKSYRSFHDSYRYECAAYELSRLVGIDQVPPCVSRDLPGVEGSLQLWIEKAMTEKGRAESNTRSPYPRRWARQFQTMYLFDTLIYNFDRNQGNILITPDWKVWFIDHTRSFRIDDETPALERIVWCERQVWDKIQSLDMGLLQAHLKPYLDRFQSKALLRRRDKIVSYLKKRIAAVGEDRVLYDRGSLTEDDGDSQEVVETPP